jgi:hypothetical protein
VTASTTAPETAIAAPWSRVRASSRLATLTVSPEVLIWAWVGPPRLATTTGPQWMPTEIRKGGSPSAASSSLRLPDVLEEVARAGQRRHGILRPRRRHAEDHHGAIAHELLEHPAMGQHGALDAAVEIAQEADGSSGAMPSIRLVKPAMSTKRMAAFWLPPKLGVRSWPACRR